MNDDLREKCGIIAVWTAGGHAPSLVRRGLTALQHRGQESAGMSIINPKGKLVTHKGMGLIHAVLTDTILKKMGAGTIGIGQNRYGTSGSSRLENAQPIVLKKGNYTLSIGHNGNIPDVSNIRNKLSDRKRTMSDTALVGKLLLQERPLYDTWEETLSSVLPQCRGAFNFVILTQDGTLFGIRDTYGIRPLCLGKLPDGWVIASESVALDAIGADFVRDIKNGEMVKISPNGALTSYFFGEPKRPKYCLFEYIYFSRPDSFINGRRVRCGREASGRLLGERMKSKGIQADVVVPTFDSGYSAAKGVAEVLQLPIVDAITTSHYFGRTFIQPGQENRIAAVRTKHNIVPDEIIGKRIVVVDDSAIRLTTTKILAQAFKTTGAAEVIMAIASPPVINQCDLGIDMRSKKDLPAARFEKESFDVIEEKVAELIGADRVIYLPIEETVMAMGGEKDDFYHYPFGGPHPIRSKQEQFAKRPKKITGKPKVCVFISGAGTNLQEIIDATEIGDIHAEIVNVVSNKEDAYGIVRANNHNIPTTILQYKGKLRDQVYREHYEKRLITHIKKFYPDIIVLAGWMLVLGREFLQETVELGIPVINLHPALLTSNQKPEIATSRGKIPVIKGVHAITAAYEGNLPVSGVTVHQVLPGNTFDTGSVILSAEVRRKSNDTLETWEQKMHEAEHMLLPTALKRVLHVMNHHNIDISKGDFPW